MLTACPIHFIAVPSDQSCFAHLIPPVQAGVFALWTAITAESFLIPSSKQLALHLSAERDMEAVAAIQAPPSSAGGGGAAPRSPGLVQHTFSATFQEEQQLFFQLVILQRQIFAWVGTAPPRLASLCLATPTRLVRSSLLPLRACMSGPLAAGTAAGIVRRPYVHEAKSSVWQQHEQPRVSRDVASHA